tara:strand:- start:2919 stop:4865 length:1947 start_codon:yes stop_codon:yes gene_type:complete
MDHKDIFIEEANELLEEVENSIIDVEDIGLTVDVVNTLFRSFHTMKGSASMLEFNEISNLTHKVEDLLEPVREGVIDTEIYTKDYVDVILKAKDQINEYLNRILNDQDIIENEKIYILIDKLKGKITSNENIERICHLDENQSKEYLYEITLIPTLRIFNNEFGIYNLINDLKENGEAEISMNISSIPMITEIDINKFYLTWDIKYKTFLTKDKIEEYFIFIDDAVDYHINEINDNEQRYEEKESIEKNIIANKIVNEINRDVRVSSSKLDELVNLMGELFVNYTQLEKLVYNNADAKLEVVLDEHNRVIETLKNQIFDIRMLPLSTVFNRFKRAVIELGKETGKKIELKITGEDVELDKSIVDKLYEPLLHIVRNSIDHGIMKNASNYHQNNDYDGTLSLNAINEGTQIKILIKDNGKGINLEQVYKAAIDKNIIDNNDNLNEDQILDLLFLPGFSTKENITNISGRGVGLDVVKQEIHKLRGSIGIDSSLNKGTTITIRLPLTLSIIDGLLVEVDNKKYIIPMASVRENFNYDDKLKYTDGRDIIVIRDEMIPLIKLRDIFNIMDNNLIRSQIVIVRIANERIGILVDKIIGPHQTVIQPFSSLVKGVNVFSGATILEDGNISLIIDLMELIDYVKRKEYVSIRNN